ncbi:hypothetical protein DNHGIG_39980 [Collibacillus ludicampi]|uniref:CobQ/CobB/MinD/ParA nucleotide binding domain-containing protein n=1 Tax=Collibacillus ludicampi TaxID=2771369 RepID=A0AAV4LKQ8_9BACL|nr:AAA family ATPase [Collibacillus ludicampi]GIM48449.1 hypothetical protein DNHGIG_39980 [Collibacillus ludicampi]
MKVLLFDINTTRLQTTYQALGERYEVTAIQTEQELLEQIPNHQIVILPEEINLDFVAEKIRRFPATFFFIVMMKKKVELVRNFMAVGVKECFKFPLTLDAFERAIQAYGLSEIIAFRQEVAPAAVAQVQEPQLTEPILEEPQREEIAEPQPERKVKIRRSLSAIQKQEPQKETKPVPQIETKPLQQVVETQVSASHPRITQPQSRPQTKMPWDAEGKTDYSAPRMQPIVRQESAEEDRQKKRSLLPFKKKASVPSYLDEDTPYPAFENRMTQSYFAPSMQQILAITSARGGVGKTTITYNLAVLAKQQLGLRTVVIDADHRGNLSPVSNTRVKYSADHWQDLDEEEVAESTVFNLLNQTKEGVYIVPAGRSIHGISGETMRKILSILKRYFQLILIDCQPFLSTGTVEAYQHASKVVVVTTDDITTFPSTIELIHQLRDQDGIGIHPGKIKLVMNQVGKDFKKEEEDILVAKTSYPVSAKLPYTPEIKKRLKSGQPIALNQKSSFTKKLQAMLGNVMETELDFSLFRKETGFFQRLFKRA